MYGPTPSMIMERLVNPPPEKMFKMPKNWLLERNLFSSTVSIPGIGIAAKTKTNSSFKLSKRWLYLLWVCSNNLSLRFFSQGHLLIKISIYFKINKNVYR